MKRLAVFLPLLLAYSLAVSGKGRPYFDYFLPKDVTGLVTRSTLRGLFTSTSAL